MKPNLLVVELREDASRVRKEFSTVPPWNVDPDRIDEAANMIEYLSAELDSLQDVAAERDEPRDNRDTYPDEVDQA